MRYSTVTNWIWGSVLLLVLSAGSYHSTPNAYKERLSEYDLFVGPLAALQPAGQVMPYDLNSALFSDYAEKARFIRIPPDSTIIYREKEAFDFPVGTIIAKTFHYPNDRRKPAKGRILLETRILLHRADGWVALPYIWNEEQTEAYLDVAGDRRRVSWKDDKGKKVQLDYSIPNLNQCKGCHSYKGQIMPIGPTARQLNGDYPYPEGTFNQLLKWQEEGWLSGLPDPQTIPFMVNYQNETAGIAERARAYLDVNCGHCHQQYGPGSTSGLFLDIHQEDPAALGVMKAPIAAGRGSGGRSYSIVPGKPDASIMLYRMDSDDPGIMMPEIGRTQIHTEGVQLIREWISQMSASH